MYQLENIIELDKAFILKEDEETYAFRCSGEVLKNPRSCHVKNDVLNFLISFYHATECT